MEAERIKEIIKSYEELQEYTEKLIDKLKKLDGDMYNTARGIELIDFYEDEVVVECDNSWCGDSEKHYFHIPISFLSMDDSELEKSVKEERDKREEEKRIEKERKEEEKRQEKEERERELYERLKRKFES